MSSPRSQSQPQHAALSTAPSATASGIANPQTPPRSGPPPPNPSHATPLKGNPQDYRYTFKHSEYTRVVNKAMDDLYVELPVETFLTRLLPAMKASVQARWDSIHKGAAKCLRSVPLVGKNEEYKMYEPLCAAFSTLFSDTAKFTGSRVPWTVKATGFNPEDGKMDLKPDLSLYDLSMSESTNFNLEQTITDVDTNVEGYKGRTLWPWIVSTFEVKSNPGAAPFNFDDSSPFTISQSEKTGHLGSASRAQMAKYVVEIYRRQHRAFVFTAFIMQDSVRFMYWDRSAALVSSPLNYKANPEPFLRFVCLLATSGRQFQGFDERFKLATTHTPRRQTIRDEAAKFKEKIPSRVSRDWFEGYRERLLDRDPLYLVDINDFDDLQKSRTFAIGSPLGDPVEEHASYSPVGRGTKVFPAWDVAGNDFVCLKLYWCAEAEGVHPELDVYRRLLSADLGAPVPYIPTPLAGGRVGGDGCLKTRSQDIVRELDLNFPGNIVPAPRFHYCVVTKELGRPLDTYEHQFVLWQCLQNALTAHKCAYQKGVLHRDISIDNILIKLMPHSEQDAPGMLNDWDLAKYLDELRSGPSQHARSGTWMYMSAPFLKWPRKPYTLADDIESFIHVVTVLALRFCLHSMSCTVEGSEDGEIDLKRNIQNTILAEFRDGYMQRHEVNKAVIGGNSKFKALRSGSSGITFFDYNCVIQLFIEAVYKEFQPFYAAIEEIEWEREYGGRRLVVKKPRYNIIVGNFLSPQPEVLETKAEGQASSDRPSSLHVLEGINHELLEKVMASVPKLFPGPGEKTRDQFLNLPDYSGQAYEKSGTGSKRPGAQENISEAKKPNQGSRESHGSGQGASGQLAGGSRDSSHRRD